MRRVECGEEEVAVARAIDRIVRQLDDAHVAEDEGGERAGVDVLDAVVAERDLAHARLDAVEGAVVEARQAIGRQVDDAYGAQLFELIGDQCAVDLVVGEAQVAQLGHVGRLVGRRTVARLQERVDLAEHVQAQVERDQVIHAVQEANLLSIFFGQLYYNE